MAEPVYKSDGPGWIGRVVSLALAGWFAWYILSSGNIKGVRACVIPLSPLAVIWFPDMAVQICAEKVSAKTASRLGWVALILLTAFPIFAWVIKGR